MRHKTVINWHMTFIMVLLATNIHTKTVKTFKMYSSNQSLKKNLVYQTASGTGKIDDTFFFENFEGDIDDWTMGDFRETNGIMWHANTFNAYEGKSWWCGHENVGGYLDSWYQVLTTPDIDLANRAAPMLSFVHYYATEYDSTVLPEENPWDGCHVRISTDGGQTYSVITPIGGYDPPDSLWVWEWHLEQMPGGMPGWHGFSNRWQEANFDLSRYIGKSVRLQFIFASDAHFNVDDDERLLGWFIDNIAVKDGGSILFYDDAEDTQDPSQLVASEGSGLYPQRCRITTTDYHSPTHSWHCDNDTSMTYMLKSPWLPLPAGDHRLFLTYWIYVDMPDIDSDNDNYLDDRYLVELTTDGIGWQKLIHDYARSDLGSDTTWVQMKPGLNYNGTLNLENWSGKTIKLRWTVITDDDEDGGRGTGLFLDDIEISVHHRATWIVDDDGEAEFSSIQDAVAAALEGDTVLVKNGVYHENIKLAKALTIRSENGPEYTKIMAADSNDHAVIVNADNVVFGGFAISGASTGIYMQGSDNCSITNNDIKNNRYGLNIYTGCSGNEFKYNRITDNMYGISILSNDNYIYLNNFNNPDNIKSAVTNQWSSPSKMNYIYSEKSYSSNLGNFWSNYTGSDENKDGVGDTDHIDFSVKDKTPLISPIDQYTIYTFQYTPQAEIKVGDEISFQVKVDFCMQYRVDGYMWQMGDGTVENGQNVSHIYRQGDIYDVNCYLSTDRGTYLLHTVSLKVLPFAVKTIASNETGEVKWLGRGSRVQMAQNNVIWQYNDDNDEEIFLYNGTNVVALSDNHLLDTFPQLNDTYVLWQHKFNFYVEKETKIYVFGSLRSNWTEKSSDKADIVLYNGAETINLSENIPINYWEKIELQEQTWTHVHRTLDPFGGEISREEIRYLILTFSGDSISANHFCEGRAVWIGKDKPYDNGRVYLFDGNTTRALTDGGYDTQYPRFFNDKIHWRGKNGDDWEIFLYENNTTTQLTDNDRDEAFAKGDGIGWYSGEADSTELYIMNDGDTVQLTQNDYQESDFTLDNDKAVWIGADSTDGEIFFYDGDKVVQLTDNIIEDGSPVIHEGLVAWVGRDDTDGEIFLYDGTQVIQLTDNSADDRDPLIGCGRVVWRGFDGSDTEIFYYNGLNTVQLTDNDFDDHSLQFDGDNIVWQDADSSIYFFSLSAACAVAADGPTKLPQNYELHQNYPNPFNAATVIEYGIPKQVRVRVKIFDVLGREIATLVDKEVQAGRYSVPWDGRDALGRHVSSGVYFYRITTNDLNKVRKMLLIR